MVDVKNENQYCTMKLKTLAAKTTVFAALVAICLPSLVLAQRGRITQEERDKRQKLMIEETITAIGVDGDARSEVSTILDEHWSKQRELMVSAREDRNFDKMRKSVLELEAQTREKLSGVLSEKELEKYDQHVEKVKSERPNRRRRGVGGI